MPAQQSGF
jgi:hypothetical protein